MSPMILIALILATFGVIMILLAAVGLLRFSLGVCCVMLGAAFGLGGTGAMMRALLAVVFLFVTIPVGAQLIARAALRNGAKPHPSTRMDLTGDCDAP